MTQFVTAQHNIESMNATRNSDSEEEHADQLRKSLKTAIVGNNSGLLNYVFLQKIINIQSWKT